MKGDVLGIGDVTALKLKLLSEEMYCPSVDDHKVTYVDLIGKISIVGTSGGHLHSLQLVRVHSSLCEGYVWELMKAEKRSRSTSLARLANAGTDRLEVNSNLSIGTRSFFPSHSIKA